MSGDGLTPELLLVILLGAISAGGVALLVHALIPREPSAVADAPSSLLDSVQAPCRSRWRSDCWCCW